AGHDQLYGGNGNDEIYGSAGNDTIYGGSGSDTYFASGEQGLNHFHGGESSSGWTDTIHIDVDEDDVWQIRINDEVVNFDMADQALALNPDSIGIISFADGSELSFDGVELITWS
ncbi:MAG: hypothetical protein KC477_10605, partial [Oceanospirillaceae bacterium]|nr:hypothetical protein [Oceanospirillaceae bacterium]